MEIPRYFNNKRHRLFGFVHEPMSLSYNIRKGIVFCHPFAEEKITSHRVMVNLARSLCSIGYFVFRFDYMGNGDSDGDFSDTSIETNLSDIICGINYFKINSYIEKISLLGIRFGATLACLISEVLDEIDQNILIQPIVQGEEYLYQCLRSNIATQMMTYGKVVKSRDDLIKELENNIPVNIDGYLITKEMYQQIKMIDLKKRHCNNHRNILLIQISKREGQITNEYKQLIASFEKNGDNILTKTTVENNFWTDSKIYYPAANKLASDLIEYLS